MSTDTKEGLHRRDEDWYIFYTEDQPCKEHQILGYEPREEYAYFASWIEKWFNKPNLASKSMSNEEEAVDESP